MQTIRKSGRSHENGRRWGRTIPWAALISGLLATLPVLIPASSASVSAAGRPGQAGGAGAAPRTLWSVVAFGEGDYFFKPSDLEADPARARLYVADSGSHRILVFDTDGRFVKAIGREGKGPGEFLRPTGLCVLDDGGIAVADYDNSRIQVFDAAGVLVRAIPVTVARVADLEAAGDRFYVVPSHGQSGFQLNMADDSPSQPLARLLDADGNPVATLTVDDLPEKEPFIRAAKHRVSIARAPDGTVYLPHFALNLIRVFDGRNALIATWTPELPFEPIEPKLEMKRALEGGVVQMRASLDSVFTGVRVGPDGRLYVLASLEALSKAIRDGATPTEPPALAMGILVLDPQTGALVRTIPCAPNTRAFALIDGGRIACLSENGDGEPVMICMTVD